MQEIGIKNILATPSDDKPLYTQAQADAMIVNALEDYIAKRKGLLWVAACRYQLLFFLCAVSGCTLNFVR